MTLELLQTFGWRIFFSILLTSRSKLHTVRTRSEVMSVVAGLVLPARRYASAGYSDRNVSVCPSGRLSVRHAPVLCQNEES